MRFALTLLLSVFAAAQTTSDPWPQSDLVEPESLAKRVTESNAPMIISVAFPVLYKSRHILHALDAGAASKPEGIAALKKLVEKTPSDAEIVIYCGCCPMNKCPNVRPAYQTLKELGFKRIRVLNVPTNMHTDWYTKNYPSEPPAAEK